MALTLTMAYSANPRIAPIADGTVQPEHFKLDVVTVEGGLLFFRNLKYDEFDASEMSISETLLAMERGKGERWDWSAIPVFPSRRASSGRACTPTPSRESTASPTSGGSESACPTTT